MDKSKTLEIVINRTLDLANDTCRVTTLSGYEPWQLLERATIDIEGVTFDGIVAEISKESGQIRYTISAPSILLTRNECEIVLEDEWGICDIVSTLAPDFTCVYEGDATYSDVDSRGLTIMEVLKRMANTLGVDVYVDGWKIIFGERTEGSGSTVSVATEHVIMDPRTTLGGYDLYTDVKGFFYDLDSGYEHTSHATIMTAADSITDVITADEAEDAGVTSAEELDNLVSKRADEIKSRVFRKRIVILEIVDIKPFDILQIGSQSYKVLEATITIAPERKTEVIVYDQS